MRGLLVAFGCDRRKWKCLIDDNLISQVERQVLVVNCVRKTQRVMVSGLYPKGIDAQTYAP